ncbi:MAG: type II restriction endonuclease [Candidatus Binataceae bacterium]|nr:type II restriction endonuclease [Candidatus Binataceae bacterium]
MPLLTFKIFRRQFDEKFRKYEVDWEVSGFYGVDGKIYAFGTDTKVISTVFETLCSPLVQEIAEENGYSVEASEQTIYPDFTLVPPAKGGPKIAVDVKTTYRRSETSKFKYTLGSYTSFLRDPNAKKNIKYPYKEYGDHWIVGFLYSRREGVRAKIYSSRSKVKADCPYKDVEFFVQEKYKKLRVQILPAGIPQI